MARSSSPSPRDLIGEGATAPGMPMPPTKMPDQGKKPRKSAGPQLKIALPKVPVKVPKVRIPGKFQPVGSSGGGEENPQVTPRNSQKGVKQQMSLDTRGGIR